MKVLPLQDEPLIAHDPRALPDFGGERGIERIDDIVVLERREATLSPTATAAR